MEFTKEKQEQLTQVVRNQQAARLVKERSFYQKGSYSLMKSCTYLEYTTKTAYHDSDDLDLSIINSELDKLQRLADITDHRLIHNIAVAFDVDDTINTQYCCDCGSAHSTIPTVNITYSQCKPLKLVQVKKRIQGLIKNVISAAEFKYKHQPNGKDVERYESFISQLNK